ncbi:hypothetical protein V2J09_001813 [Rumex salicifolius]
MATNRSDPLQQVETTCGTLLFELQVIWDEVGEKEADRDKMLLELERECMEVYRRKVDQANRCRAQLRQAIADAEAELASICSAMGERPVHIRQSEQKAASLKEELSTIHPQVEEMRKRKQERKNQFIEIIEQIQKVSKDIYGVTGGLTTADIDESDLSIRRLEELQAQLQMLQKDKSDRLNQVMLHLSCLNILCSVLGLDFKQTLNEVHPSLSGSEETFSLSNDTLQALTSAIIRLREVKVQRMQRLQDLASTMLELWNLMDTPIEEQQAYQNVTCNIAASEDEITDPNMLSSDFIDYVEAEVSRLEELKSSKMKELVMKKRSELEDICRKTHLVPETNVEPESVMEAIESGALDPAVVLEQIELEIGKVKEEAFSRKEILDRVEKWLSACEEESWLEDYNMDENRYNAGRGAHLILKRAEKARALVNKLPGMVDTLAAKARAWENERDIEFTYDGVRVLSMLEEYTILRQEKEEEKRRQREQKKLQGQLIAEQEALFGSKPSPMKLQSAKKTSRMSSGCGNNNNRRLSLGGNMHQTPRPDSVHSNRATPHSRQGKKAEQRAEDDMGLTNANVRRGLDIGNQMARRPFSPISSTTSSRVNTPNPTSIIFEDSNRMPTNASQMTMLKNEKSVLAATANPLMATPIRTKTTQAVDEENRTPQAMKLASYPCTPATVSAPMQTAMTPAYAPSFVAEENEEEIEYSFEERRAGFVLPSSSVKRAIQV